MLRASRLALPLVQALPQELALPMAWLPGLVLLLALQPGPLLALPQALVLLLASLRALPLPLGRALQQELALLLALLLVQVLRLASPRALPLPLVQALQRVLLRAWPPLVQVPLVQALQPFPPRALLRERASLLTLVSQRGPVLPPVSQRALQPELTQAWRPESESLYGQLPKTQILPSAPILRPRAEPLA